MRFMLFALVGLVLHCAAASAATIVFAAASLTDALGEAARAYEAGGGGKVTLVFAASSDLARQVEHGAPADLFISADSQWTDYLDHLGLLDRPSKAVLLHNRLVLVAPAASKIALAIGPGFPLVQALGGDRLAVGDPDHVPAGIYARQALENLGVWAQVEPRLARAASVRAALALIERAECPLGVVYLTDAKADDKVRIVDTFPESSHPPVIYPAALLAGHGAAAGFLRYLEGPDGQALFRRYGFETGS